MPIGVPRVGGSPIGGPMGGLIPGGGAIIPRKKNGRKKKNQWPEIDLHKYRQPIFDQKKKKK